MESWVSSEHRIALAIKVSTWRSNSQSHIQQAGAPGTLVGAAKCTAAIRLSDSGRIPIEGPSSATALEVDQEGHGSRNEKNGFKAQNRREDQIIPGQDGKRLGPKRCVLM